MSAVLAASVAIAVISVSIAPFADVPAVTAVLTLFGSLLALQSGYLGGLALSCIWTRMLRCSLPATHESALSAGRWTVERQSSQVG